MAQTTVYIRLTAACAWMPRRDSLLSELKKRIPLGRECAVIFLFIVLNIDSITACLLALMSRGLISQTKLLHT